MKPLQALAAFILLSLASVAQSATQVEVLDTWPQGDRVALGANQHFYVHLRYHLDAPAHIWVRPYIEGEAAKAGSHPSRIYAAGDGEALGWFFLSNDSVRVDEVRIRVGNGSAKGTHDVAAFPVSVTGGGHTLSDASRPEWATRLLALDKQAQDESYHKAMSEPITPAEEAFFTGFMLTMLALGVVGAGWPIRALRRWQGGWKTLAALPALVMAFVILNIIVGALFDPTSHNLWPFEIIMWGACSTLWMLALVLLRRVLGVRQES